MMFKALSSNSITLYLITEQNLQDVYSLFSGFPDSTALLAEINENYLPNIPMANAWKPAA